MSTLITVTGQVEAPNLRPQVSDVVLVRVDTPITTRWPLARVVQVHPGVDGTVRVVTIRTASGTCKKPVVKLALLLPIDDVV